MSVVLLALSPALADVGPLLSTRWGQSGAFQRATPLRHGAPTYPGCTTVAAAQVLAYYRYQDHTNTEVSYVLEHDGLTGPDIADGVLTLDLTEHAVRWDELGDVDAVATFLYRVGTTLHAQFGGGEGSSATGRQIENAFRYQWGYNDKRRRDMTIVSRTAFGYDDLEWADLIRGELDAGRPVLYMAQQVDADAGHAFVIDGYRDRDGLVHVNFGWGGHADGWYDVNDLTDPSGRSWTRDAMIFKGLEPVEGFAAELLGASTPQPASSTWHGNGSVIALSSGAATGYGLTTDEAMVHSALSGDPAVFFQWEVDPADGTRLRVHAEGHQRATLTYGPWSDRDTDRTYVDVTLPFVLDPAADGFDVVAQPWYTLAVQLDGAPEQDGVVTVSATGEAASAGTSRPADPVLVDGHTWTGNGSLIGKASGRATGYGLTRDEAWLPAGTAAPPVVFFQWEVDTSDGTRLRLDAGGVSTATLRVGDWASRADDLVRTVELPFVLDLAAEGLPATDGSYLTLQLAFDAAPSSDTVVTAVVE